MDVDTIEPGLDWMQAIDRAVGSADLVLALIGTDWLNEFERRGRALPAVAASRRRE